VGPIAFVIVLTAVIFLAVILNLAAKPSFSSQITGTAVFLAAVGGLLIYGWGFAETVGNPLLATIRATLAVCGMFVGKNDFAAISSAGCVASVWMQLLFWVLHLFAFYATASAAIATVGANALRRLRLWLARRGDLTLIFGVNPDSVDFGCHMASQKHHAVVFVDGQPDASGAAVIAGAGMVLRSDSSAVRPNQKFLRSAGIRPGKRNILVYALDKDMAKDLAFAEQLLAALQAAGIHSAQTRLAIPGAEYAVGASFQALGEHYGFGSVDVFNEPMLAARTMVRAFPPCDTVRFSSDGRAEEDLDVLIIGFGMIGQAALRYLVMNGQFTGSHFHAAVFARNCMQVNGHFTKSFCGMMEHYDISFHPYDARSAQMYAYLEMHRSTLKYVVICMGNDAMNGEIANELLQSLRTLGCAAPVHICSHQSVSRMTGVDQPIEKYSLFAPEVLCFDRMDRMAMVVNQAYCAGNGRTKEENWLQCDYFSRMSNRAYADFIPAVLRSVGRTREEVAASGWALTPEQKLNLGKTEHDRWCAFHYAMGFRPMPKEEFDRRARQYEEEKRQTGSSRIRISKDMVNQYHACLIPWDALIALGEREGAITGRTIDYQQMDVNNVLSIPDMLRSGIAE